MLEIHQARWVVVVEPLPFVIVVEAPRSVVDQVITILAPDRGCVPLQVMLRAMLATVPDKEVLDGVERFPLTLDSTFDTILLRW
ncbi:MAG: hypothetical protein ACYS9Y_02245 [Planctomycetota bacterium]|jgi:hypothetical protein